MFVDVNANMAMETILCAVDFSETSIQAIRWAITEAQSRKTHVTFLFCYRLIAAGDEVESLNMKKDMEAKALAQFGEIERKFINSSKVPYQFIMEVGFFPSRIEMFIRKSPVSLLIIGSSIIENFNEYKNLTFDQFLLTSKIPVVVVPDTERSLLAV
jgi:nucleotide-binding universal stress UspA family protein